MSEACPQFDDETCPRHGGPVRKCYTFGSTMSAETDVYTFHGCRCAVSVQHDPVGTYAPSVYIHDSYRDAAGTGTLASMMAAAKYR